MSYDEDKSSKLFITNLPPNVSSDLLAKDIEPMFANFGQIKALNVKRHQSGMYSYAFLEYENTEDAQRAEKKMDQAEVHGRPMKVYDLL